MERLVDLRAHGPSPRAFTFASACTAAEAGATGAAQRPRPPHEVSSPAPPRADHTWTVPLATPIASVDPVVS
ncbi:hypothetical protein [Streptomyces collinus]|uniref:hypothetical protein n=1 Tax=Streptomyces collinus TaxID=42684 RepID=UPI0036411A6F